MTATHRRTDHAMTGGIRACASIAAVSGRSMLSGLVMQTAAILGEILALGALLSHDTPRRTLLRIIILALGRADFFGLAGVHSARVRLN